jgi:hypothetical protein
MEKFSQYSFMKDQDRKKKTNKEEAIALIVTIGLLLFIAIILFISHGLDFFIR